MNHGISYRLSGDRRVVLGSGGCKKRWEVDRARQTMRTCIEPGGVASLLVAGGAPIQICLASRAPKSSVSRVTAPDLRNRARKHVSVGEAQSHTDRRLGPSTAGEPRLRPFGDARSTRPDQLDCHDEQEANRPRVEGSLHEAEIAAHRFASPGCTHRDQAYEHRNPEPGDRPACVHP